LKDSAEANQQRQSNGILIFKKGREYKVIYTRRTVTKYLLSEFIYKIYFRRKKSRRRENIEKEDKR